MSSSTSRAVDESSCRLWGVERDGMGNRGRVEVDGGEGSGRSAEVVAVVVEGKELRCFLPIILQNINQFLKSLRTRVNLLQYSIYLTAPCLGLRRRRYHGRGRSSTRRCPHPCLSPPLRHLSSTASTRSVHLHATVSRWQTRRTPAAHPGR